MIAHDIEPIGHVPPLKRIDLTPVWPKEEPDTISFYDAINSAAKAIADKAEADRIWKLVVNVAEARGTGMAPAIDHPGEAPAADVPSIDAVYPGVVNGETLVFTGFVDGLDDTAPSEYLAPTEDVA